MFRKILIRDGYAQINEKIHVKKIQIVINLFIVVDAKKGIIWGYCTIFSPFLSAKHLFYENRPILNVLILFIPSHSM